MFELFFFVLFGTNDRLRKNPFEVRSIRHVRNRFWAYFFWKKTRQTSVRVTWFAKPMCQALHRSLGSQRFERLYIVYEADTGVHQHRDENSTPYEAEPGPYRANRCIGVILSKNGFGVNKQLFSYNPIYYSQNCFNFFT